ncbi:helix-turn-helix transcriptional regulator [Mycolicibacterium lutetiense]
MIHQLIEQIYAVADRDDAPARLLTDSVGETLKLVITNMCAMSPPTATRRGPDTLDSATRAKIIEFLEDGIDSTITLETLAQQAKMPVGVFITAFRAAFRTTPYQYLLDRRFERAKFLLRNTDHAVAEISAMVGFSRPGHFSTAFRRRVGVSPRAYRSNH